MHKIFKAIVVLLFIVVSACQTSQIDDGDGSGVPAAEISAVETIGSGPNKVTLILHQSGPLAENNDPTDYKSGASLAVNDLGPQSISMSIFDAKSQPEMVGQIVRSEIKQKTQLIIIPGDGASIRNAQKLSGGKVPIVTLGAHLASNNGVTYAFIPDGLTSIIEGVKKNVTSDKRKLALVISSNQIPHAVDRIGKSVAKFADLHVAIAFKPNENSDQIIRENLTKLSESDVIVFASEDQKTVEIAGKISKSVKNANQKIIIGRDDWNTQVSSQPLLSRARVATLDTNDVDIIADRYNNKYARPVNRSAALAYDLMSVTAGLVRSGNTSKITKESLERNSGFRGTLGAFRFRADGSVERLYREARYSNGALVEIGAAPKRF
ncbi:MAG: hypothetical protein ACR2O3_15170 [Rhizobiaceae bacterium]